MIKIPFFSVIICTYNRAGLIIRAIDSLQNQTCTDWEAIIVDDASSDNTREVLAPYLKENIRYVRHTRQQGCAHSKNTGVEAARGRYFTFLDSDDEYKPNHLEIRKSLLSGQPGIDLLHSDVEVIGNEFVPDKDDPARLIAIKDCVIGGTFVIRKDALTPADKFQDQYSDDSSFLEGFIQSGRMAKRIKSPTYIYHRDVADSMCNLAQTTRSTKI